MTITNTTNPTENASGSTVLNIVSRKWKRRRGVDYTPQRLSHCRWLSDLQGYLPPRPMDMTTPMRMAAATITRSRFCRITDPVSVPVIIFVIRESITTKATHHYPSVSREDGLSLHPLIVGCPPSSLYTRPKRDYPLLLGSGLAWQP